MFNNITFAKRDVRHIAINDFTGTCLIGSIPLKTHGTGNGMTKRSCHFLKTIKLSYEPQPDAAGIDHAVAPKREAVQDQSSQTRNILGRPMTVVPSSVTQ